MWTFGIAFLLQTAVTVEVQHFLHTATRYHELEYYLISAGS